MELEKTELRKLIEGDLAASVAKNVKKDPISFLDWLEMAKEDPSLVQLSHERIFKIIDSAGYEEISHRADPRKAKLLELESDEVMMVPKFYRKFKGIEWALVDISDYLYSAAGQGEASRQILFMWGPPGGGKSTIATMMRRSMEDYGFWQIEGCDHHDNPINAIPRHLRKELHEKFGIYVDPPADICAQCRDKLINEYVSDYTRFNVEWRNFSQRRGCGIAVVSEVDPINFNMAVIIGEEDISRLGKYKRGDPKTLRMTGAASRGGRGWTELVEIWKNPVEAQRFLLTLTQEKYVPLPKFIGQVYVDTMVVGHSNEEEWNRFKDDKSNEATIDRAYVVKVPYNLSLQEEKEIYKDSFLGQSLKFRDPHIDPHVLEQVAMFILFTRLSPTDKCDALSKIKIYDGQEVSLKGVDLTYAELKKEADWREGIVGLSYRTPTKGIIEKSIAYHRHKWERDPDLRKRGYLNVLWVRQTLIRYIKNLDISRDGEWPKASKQRWLAFVQDDLHKELIRLLEEDIIKAANIGLNISLDQKMESIFSRYVLNAIAFSLGYEHDVALLESIDKSISSTPQGAESFRRGVAKVAMELGNRNEKYSLKDADAAVREAIKTLVKRPILDDIVAALKEKSKYRIICNELLQMGYARMGIKPVLKYALNHIGRD